MAADGVAPGARLGQLALPFRALVLEVIGACADRGVGLVVASTLRTKREQQIALMRGVSLSGLASLHLPDAEGRAHAVDLVPTAVLEDRGLHAKPPRGIDDMPLWRQDGACWQVLGEEAERLGLGWGGRWEWPRQPWHVQDAPVELGAVQPGVET